MQLHPRAAQPRLASAGGAWIDEQAPGLAAALQGVPGVSGLEAGRHIKPRSVVPSPFLGHRVTMSGAGYAQGDWLHLGRCGGHFKVEAGCGTVERRQFQVLAGDVAAVLAQV